ncbi:MAG: hypothetical protein KY453_03555, partial [Gemmatimonadetes bacterium]|nr:hypothetical protein [Gemmatimonadota bacterium]
MRGPRTRRATRRIASAALALGIALPASTAAQSPAVAWDVTEARGRTYEIDFTTDEGTWMSVDVSPDGRWLVFDLLGHVYRMPAEGGAAESLTQADRKS